MPPWAPYIKAVKNKRCIMASPAATAANDLGALPVWDLNDLYHGLDSTALKQDLAQVAERATAMEKQHKGKVAGLPGDDLAALIAEYEQLHDLAGRMYTSASVSYSGQ